MKTKIYLVRHAEVNNPNKIIYGRLGRFGLSDSGKEQAAKLREYFSDKRISAIYASPLLRTRQSAEIISNGKIPIHFSKLLLEVNLKQWEGKEACKLPKKELSAYKNNPLALNLGESLLACQSRMVKKIERVAKKHRGENIILVSHAHPILTAMFYFKNSNLNSINKTGLKKASVTSLEFDEELKCNRITYKEIVKTEKDLL